MLSILIPTYNYNVFPLAKVLSKAAEVSAHPIEIIILDDASTTYHVDSDIINKLPHLNFSKLHENVGRTLIRQELAKKASYQKILFLDADVLPVYSDFIPRYLKHIDRKGIILGGITYREEKPNEDEMLRWTYGHAREKRSVAQRDSAKYSTITTGNFLIDKETFLAINTAIQVKTYGEDLLFKHKLEEQQIPVHHIDNPVYHLGLETNEQFLEKSLEAIATTIALEAEGELPANSRNLQKLFLKLKKWRLIAIFELYFSSISSKVKRNLLSGSPNMRWFDLYRLNYYIQLKKQKSA